nr:thrombospondin type-1 domain-containing protein 4-like [Salvelinus alpinus]
MTILHDYRARCRDQTRSNPNPASPPRANHNPASQPRANPNSNPNPAPQHRSSPPWSSSLYQSSQGHQPRQEQQHSSSQASAAQQPFGRPYNPLPTSSCVGEHNQYKICNNNACPPASRHIRAVQCSSYNSYHFMGRLYEWEPFNEVSGDQRCELNCRAIGFRFYVRQSDRVIDGTPCGQNETFICVAGRCQVGHLTHLPVAWPGLWTPAKPLRIEQNSDRMDGIRGKKSIIH